MNNGQICVSVCAETADELIAQIKRAEDLADVIEIRFDCLKLLPDTFWNELNKRRKSFDGNLLATFRPDKQGGNRDLSFTEREDFWIHSHVSEFVDWADLEGDFSEEKINNFWGKSFNKIINSFHDFHSISQNLESVYEQLSTAEDIIKIAAQADDITDTIPVWKLLEKAESENKQIIPIAMGEAGKWTRILGLAHGAFMTYAALDAGKETAPGQVSARDLIEVYRVKELNENTDVYGIIGGNTSVSMSPYIHNTAFQFHNLNAVFVPLQVNTLDEFIIRMVKPKTREIELNFKGFSVTIPHKTAIIKHLDSIDETAEKIGAVNTIKIVDGKLHGFNTDADGFIEPLLNVYGDLRNARIAVLGAGGAARACIYALQKNGANVTIFARDLEKSKNLADDFRVELRMLDTHHSAFSNFDVLVNTTPLGMKNKAETETPAAAEQMRNLKLVYDLVYTPFQTKFMTEADRAAVPKIGGLAMLIAQAAKQQKIWTNLDAPLEQMSRAALKKLQ